LARLRKPEKTEKSEGKTSNLDILKQTMFPENNILSEPAAAD